MMKRSARSMAALVLLSFCVPAGLAQEKKPHEGEWLAQYPPRNNPNNILLVALVVLKGSGGTWNVKPPSMRNKNPCLGRDYPVAVVAETADSVELAVYASKALTSCTDHTVKLKPIDDKTLEGLIDDERKVTLKRR